MKPAEEVEKDRKEYVKPKKPGYAAFVKKWRGGGRQQQLCPRATRGQLASYGRGAKLQRTMFTPQIHHQPDHCQEFNFNRYESQDMAETDYIFAQPGLPKGFTGWPRDGNPHEQWDNRGFPKLFFTEFTEFSDKNMSLQ